MSEILSDTLASETIAEASRGRYLKTWADFKAFSDQSDEFDNRMPTESEFVEFFKHLRTNKKSSSSSLWTIYSMLNSVCKGKYSERLQKFPRITSLLKSYNGDVKKKAAVFEDKGATAQQMTDFYGWKSVNMAQEYISTSKNAVNNVATLLKSSESAGESEPVEDDLVLQESSLGQSTACNSEPARKSIIIHNLTFNNGNLNF